MFFLVMRKDFVRRMAVVGPQPSTVGHIGENVKDDLKGITWDYHPIVVEDFQKLYWADLKHDSIVQVVKHLPGYRTVKPCISSQIVLHQRGGDSGLVVSRVRVFEELRLFRDIARFIPDHLQKIEQGIRDFRF